jgi:hypothetical protein
LRRVGFEVGFALDAGTLAATSASTFCGETSLGSGFM